MMKIKLREIAHGRSGDNGDVLIYPEFISGSLTLSNIRFVHIKN